MQKLNLILVPPAKRAHVYNNEQGMRRMLRLKKSLLAAAAQYVRDGATGTRNDRVRASSEATGIPRNLIEIAVGE